MGKKYKSQIKTKTFIKTVGVMLFCGLCMYMQANGYLPIYIYIYMYIGTHLLVENIEYS